MLFLNATDLDRSREYGQESIIYSLEGSSQFRINARSGEPPWSPSSPPQADSPCPARDPPRSQVLPPFPRKPSSGWSMPAWSTWFHPDI